MNLNLNDTIVTLESVRRDLAYMDVSDPIEVGDTVDEVVSDLDQLLRELNIEHEEDAKATILIDPELLDLRAQVAALEATEKFLRSERPIARRNTELEAEVATLLDRLQGAHKQANLGKADWEHDHEYGYHMPCCSRLSPDGRHRCGNGPLTGCAIYTGDCGEHGHPHTHPQLPADTRCWVDDHLANEEDFPF